MPEPENTSLRNQYAEQVAADLEKNEGEQQRITAEIEALQTQLTTLQQDHELLQGVRSALGTGTTPALEVPSPRRTQSPGKATTTRKESAPKTVGKKADRKKTAATTGEKGPALTDLIHGHLSRRTEPHTAAEIAKALDKAHPDRKISDNTVRTSTERLVARGKVERAKQGATVYYTAITPEAPNAKSAEPEKATA